LVPAAGAIVNLWFPNWLLCLMWVVVMACSNVELLLSFIKYMNVKKEAKAITERLRIVSPPASSGGAAAATAGGSVEMTSAANGDGSSRHRVQQQQQQTGVAGMTRSELIQEHSELMDRAQLLAKRAHKIEALALLYPTLYVPDVGRALEVRVMPGVVCQLSWLGQALVQAPLCMPRQLLLSVPRTMYTSLQCCRCEDSVMTDAGMCLLLKHTYRCPLLVPTGCIPQFLSDLHFFAWCCAASCSCGPAESQH
jgi:hypothetical protein